MEAKLTVNENSPSAELIKKAAAEITITDARGRTITLKKPNLLAQFRLVEVIGETARNSAYMSMVVPLTYVVAIGGDPTLPPQSQRELDVLIQRLDEHGYMAVIDGIKAHFSETSENNEEGLKNS